MTGRKQFQIKIGTVGDRPVGSTPKEITADQEWDVDKLKTLGELTLLIILGQLQRHTIAVKAAIKNMGSHVVPPGFNWRRDLKLSTRSTNCLLNYLHPTTFQDFLNHTEHEVLVQIANLGPTSLAEIKGELRRHGLRFRLGNEPKIQLATEGQHP